MNTTALKLGMLGLLLALGAVVPWQIWHRAQFQARAKNEELQAAAFKELATENSRLSNAVAQAAIDSLSIEQFHELLRLRGTETGAERSDDD